MVSGADRIVNNATAHEPSSNLHVPFTNVSDTLIAKLRLENGLSNSTINMFLKVLRDPAFEPRTLTIEQSADIDQRVADYRRTIGLKRSERHGPSTVPYPILESILDSLVEDTSLADEPIRFQLPLLHEMELRRDHCLRDMTLVHPAWTLASQRRLAKRIIIRSPSQTLRLLRNPIIGSFTQEILVAYGPQWNRGYQITDDPLSYNNPDDFEADLAHLLEGLPKLRSLTVMEDGFQGDLLLSVISRKASLETLKWSRAYGLSYGNLARLGETLNCLQNLKHLEISGWASNEPVDYWIKWTPRFQLHELKLCLAPGDLYATDSGWLLGSLSLSFATKLSLDISSVRTLNLAETFQQFPRCLEALRMLNTLHITNKGCFLQSNLQQARSLLRSCENLKSLHLQCQKVAIVEFIDILPSSLEELRFSWFDMWVSPWGLAEAYIPPLLRSNTLPLLKRIIIHNYEIAFEPDASRDERGRPDPHPMRETQAICDRLRIELDLYSKPPDWRSI